MFFCFCFCEVWFVLVSLKKPTTPPSLCWSSSIYTTNKNTYWGYHGHPRATQINPTTHNTISGMTRSTCATCAQATSLPKKNGAKWCIGKQARILSWHCHAKGVNLLKRHFSHDDMISTSRGIRPQLAMAMALVTAFTPPLLSFSSDPVHKGSRREANRVGDSLICHDILNTRIPKDYVAAKTNLNYYDGLIDYKCNDSEFFYEIKILWMIKFMYNEKKNTSDSVIIFITTIIYLVTWMFEL